MNIEELVEDMKSYLRDCGEDSIKDYMTRAVELVEGQAEENKRQAEALKILREALARLDSDIFEDRQDIYRAGHLRGICEKALDQTKEFI